MMRVSQLGEMRWAVEIHHTHLGWVPVVLFTTRDEAEECLAVATLGDTGNKTHSTHVE